MGITGVAWDVNLMIAKAFENENGTAANAAEAIIWAADKGADVINGSFGSKDESWTLRNAIVHARNRGVVCVFAAGNYYQNMDSNPLYPAYYSGNYDHVISVGAIDQSGNRPAFSNWGKTRVNVFAPGVSILSTWNNKNYPYGYLDGISMAAPHVAGTAALLVKRFGGTPASVIARIENSVMSPQSIAISRQLKAAST